MADAQLTYAAFFGAYSAKKQRVKALAASFNSVYGIGPSHINTAVFIGRSDQLAIAFEQIKDECTRGVRVECLANGMRIRNVTRQEGTFPVEFDPICTTTVEPAPESLCVAGKDPTQDPSFAPQPIATTLAPVKIATDESILVLAVEYMGWWNGASIVRSCTRIAPFRSARVSSLDLTTLASPGDLNRISLLRDPARSDVVNKLRSGDHAIIHVRDLVSYSAGRSGDDFLRDNQEVRLTLSRAPSELEMTRLGLSTGSQEQPPIETLWRLTTQDMPKFRVRFPIMLGLAMSEKHQGETGPESIWTIGPAVAASYRWKSNAQYYLGVDGFIYIAARLGTAPEIQSLTWGPGVQFDLSGYLGVGFAVLAPTTFDRDPIWTLTLAPLPWLTQALGLQIASK
jgi:hypothetical protein